MLNEDYKTINKEYDCLNKEYNSFDKKNDNIEKEYDILDKKADFQKFYDDSDEIGYDSKNKEDFYTDYDFDSNPDLKLKYRNDLLKKSQENKDISLKLPVFDKIVCEQTEKQKEDGKLSDMFAIILILILISICVSSFL